MPLYEYKCDTCGTVVEQLRRAADRPTLRECSECGGDWCEPGLLWPIMSVPGYRMDHTVRGEITRTDN
jgi:putative FmdB family regulatory protein